MSLGVSCQTEHQIQGHRLLWTELLGDRELKPSASFFDWLICPVEASISLFSTGFEEIKGDSEIELKGRPSWRPHGLCFWHEEPDIAAIQSKFTFLRARFLALENCKRLVFCISNTQHNMAMIRRALGGFDPVFSGDRLQAIVDAVEGLMRRKCDFIFVTNEERTKISGPIGDRAFVHLIDRPAHDETWHGNPAQWEMAFSDHFHWLSATSKRRGGLLRRLFRA